MLMLPFRQYCDRRLALEKLALIYLKKQLIYNSDPLSFVLFDNNYTAENTSIESYKLVVTF